MDAPRARALTPARIVALAVVAVLVVGLGYLRVTTGTDRLAVPDGAKAGQLVLEPCEYATEDGAYGADCGTLVVPENRADPQSRLVALPVTRIRARSARPAEPIFRLGGGPGGTNMEFDRASRFAQRHDVVLVGYRGVDGSSVLDCREVESALAHSTDLLGERTQRAYAEALRACADRLAGAGVDLRGYSLPQRVDDLEAARVALGYDRIHLLSESAGTRTALIYAWRYPDSVHRSVLIGANPPGGFVWDARTTDLQVRRYAALCERDERCSTRTDDLAESLTRAAGDIPDRWLFLPIKEGNVRVATFYGLVEASSEQPISAPMTLDSWLWAEDGDASGFWFQSLLADVAFPKAFVWGDVAAASRADADAAKRYFASDRARGTALGDPGTQFLWAGGRTLDAWPATPDEDDYGRMRTSSVETLVIGGELDFATPPQVAKREVMPHLPNGHRVVLAGFGHTTDFWTQQPEAGTRLIGTFLASGRVDDSRYERGKVDFAPSMSQGAIAKIVAGSLVGLAALAVLSLGWMAVRVRARGAFGRKGSVALRSLSPVLLGVGGWLLGVLVVIATMPGVPIDGELLVAVSVGAPIGLGLYLAWVDRRWSTTAKSTGLAAAVAGALLGAWLGFNAADDLVALLTSIAGAAAGGNLLLLVLDAAWDRQARDRFAAPTAPDTSAAASAG
ncbi:MAG: alpha/beta hydrolase [Thermoleophilia bacterium]|nr:alpha/beta hydrolase [Thermoleophilia bacterium]